MKALEQYSCTIGKVEKVVVVRAPGTKKTGTIETICPGCKFHKGKSATPVEWGITLNRVNRISRCHANY